MKKIILILAILLLIVLGILGVLKIRSDLDTQTESSIKNAVISSAIQCCAIEGAYPSSIDYLEDNYGLRIDRDRYIVAYEVFASNIFPEVTIIKK